MKLCLVIVVAFWFVFYKLSSHLCWLKLSVYGCVMCISGHSQRMRDQEAARYVAARWLCRRVHKALGQSDRTPPGAVGPREKCDGRVVQWHKGTKLHRRDWNRGLLQLFLYSEWMSLCLPPLIETYREGAVCPSYACFYNLQFSFKSATETSECKAHVANS